MATQAQTQQPQNQPTSNKGDKLKLILGGVVLLGFVFLACGFFVGFTIRSGLDVQVEPTPTPTPSPTLTPSPTTSIVEPTDTPDPGAYDGWSTFVLSDCNVRVKVPPTWYSGKRGDLDACGSFRTIENTGFDGFDDYAGTLIVFTQMFNERDSDSVLAFKYDEAERYLKAIETDPEKATPDEDLLLGDVREEVLVDKDVTRALINRASIGVSEHIFYALFGTEYAIIYGGQTLDASQDEINLILQSIEFIQPLQNE